MIKVHLIDGETVDYPRATEATITDHGALLLIEETENSPPTDKRLPYQAAAPRIIRNSVGIHAPGLWLYAVKRDETEAS